VGYTPLLPGPPGSRRSTTKLDGSVFARVHVLVLCDEVEELPGGEDLFNLSGVRMQVHAPTFPYVHPQFCVYLQVTGQEGIASGRAVVVKETTEEEIFYRSIDAFQLSGPLEITSIWLRMRDCEFPEPGYIGFRCF
jgi:hypothetical protein